MAMANEKEGVDPTEATEFDTALDETDLDLDLSNEELGAAGDDDAPSAEAGEQPEETPKEEGKEPAAPEGEAPTPEPEAKEPEPEAAAESEPVTAPAQPQEQPPQYTPEQLAEAQKAAIDQARATLQKHFEERVKAGADDMETGLVEALPSLLTEVYLGSVQNAVAAIMQQLPGVISQQHVQASREEQYVSQFFDSFPQIDRNNPEHYATAERLGRAYVTANPGTAPEQIIQDVGVQTIMALKLPVEVEGAEASVKVKEKPFSPAAAQPPRSGPAPKGGMFEEFDKEFEAAEANLDLD